MVVNYFSELAQGSLDAQLELLLDPPDDPPELPPDPPDDPPELLLDPPDDPPELPLGPLPSRGPSAFSSWTYASVPPAYALIS